MSIERMENIFLVVPSHSRKTFLKWLYRERQVHLDEFRETPEPWSSSFQPISEDYSFAETQVSRLQSSLEFLNAFSRKKGDFLESLFPVRILASKQEIETATKSINPEELATRCQKLQGDIESIQNEHTRLLAERSRLLDLSFITHSISRLKSIQYAVFHIVGVTGTLPMSFLNDNALSEDIHAESVFTKGNTTFFVLVSAQSNEERVQELILTYNLREIPLPNIQGTIADELTSLEKAIQKINEEEKIISEEVLKLADEAFHNAELALAYWESERNRIFQQEKLAVSNNIFAAHGYIRAKYRNDFKTRMEREFPGSELMVVPLDKNVEPPVSVTWNTFLRPAGLLVKMFGLPSYKGIDPTAFLTLTFFTFFGICYGDVLYGIMLLYVAWWLKKRFRNHKGLVEFFKLFSYAGVSTIIFGVATGSWGADLPAYFGKGNMVDTLRLKLTLLDPLTKPVVALGIAVGIGVANQLYGIFMRFLRDLRRGDIASSLFDGVFWLVYLISLLTFAIAMVIKAPQWFIFTALAVFFLAATGLVLTQGRNQNGWVLRLITGVVSLYGIMGTYGTTAFIGDVISYSRLMALGMTTYVVGMSFNIIAGLLKEIPYVGWFLFIIMIIFGHIFNFFMSILSAFVHSARLILLEWFGRFYEGGGVPFVPYGFSSSRLELVEK